MQMPQIYTIISFDGGTPLRCTMRRIGSVERHVHEYFELDMLLTGSCQVTVGSEVFTARADDVFSVEAHTPHSLLGADCTVITVHFEQSFFERMLPQPKHPSFFCNSALQGDNTLLFTNATQDLVSSFIFASTYGIGMALAAPVLFCWQGMFYLIAKISATAISDALMCELLIIGGLIITASGLSLLKIRQIKTLDMLPALLVPVLWFIGKWLIGLIAA